jgi:hypothetical protein
MLDTSPEDRFIESENFTLKVGRYSYGINNIKIQSWGGKAQTLL